MATTQEQQDKILDFYLNHNDPNADPQAFYDADQQAAERAAAAGGQSFSGARRGLLRRSQVLENLNAAQPILAQRAGFEQQTRSQTQSELADLKKLAQAGEQAKDLERLSQQGQLRHDTDAAAAQRADTILKGQQALVQLQQDNQGKVILAQMGITAEKIKQDAQLANENWQLQQRIAAAASEGALDRSFKVSDNAANRASNFNSDKLRANTQLATTRIGNPTYSASDTHNALQQIIGSTGGGVVGAGPGGQSSPYGSSGNGGQQPNNNDFGGELNAGGGGGASYYFGDNSPNTNPAGQQKYGTNSPITDDDFYYLTGGESG